MANNDSLYWCGLGIYHSGVEVYGCEYAFGHVEVGPGASRRGRVAVAAVLSAIGVHESVLAAKRHSLTRVTVDAPPGLADTVLGFEPEAWEAV